jgi:hypothetical protein
MRQITQSGNVPIFLSPLRADDCVDRLDKSYPLILGSFSCTLWTSKYFKLPNFSLLDSAAELRGWLKQRGIFFSGEMNHHTIAGCAYKVEYHWARQVSSFLILAFKSLTLPFIALLYRTHSSCRMVGETDQTLHAVGEGVADDTKTASGVESNDQAASSSSNATIEKMVNKDHPVLSDYWKKSTVTEADRTAYHTVGWLGGALESFVPEVGIPMVDNSTVVYFESHLVAGLGLPPSKFPISIMNILRCELVHLNPNVIAALSCFTMLCECWLGIAPDTSLFWYFYGLVRYDNTVFSGIGLPRRRHR